MATTIQGSKQDPLRVDVQLPDGTYVMGVDLANLPPGTVIKGVRRTFSLLKDRIYLYRTEFIDQLTGGTKERISLASQPAADVEWIQNNTAGLVDSPLTVELWDIT